MAYGSGVGVAWTASPLEHVGAVCLPTLCRRRRAARPKTLLDVWSFRIYTIVMRFAWSAKRKSNLDLQGFDFVDAPKVFAGPTYTYEDDRFDYT